MTLNIKTKTYAVTAKVTGNYNSFSVSEGFEVELDDDFNEFDFESQKQALKDKVMSEAKEGLEALNEQPNYSDISIDEEL